jgi:cytochrome b6-f complex iron-sulfur subunit
VLIDHTVTYKSHDHHALWFYLGVIMKRREALKTIGISTVSLAGAASIVGCAPSAQEGSRNVAAQGGVKVGKTSDFPKVGSSLEFDFGGSPAIAVRTATAQANGLSANGLNFVALSRICTHLGCTIGLPDGTGNMGCGCHGSVFQAQTGAVVNGPANKPLASIKLELRGTDLYAVGV